MIPMIVLQRAPQLNDLTDHASTSSPSDTDFDRGRAASVKPERDLTRHIFDFTTQLTMISVLLGEGEQRPPSSPEGSPKNNEAQAINEEQRCKYPRKYCGRARARKTIGVMHRFCQYHRLKANTNPKRWTSVRRQQVAVDEQHRLRSEYLARVHAARQLFINDNADDDVYWRRMMGELPDPVSIESTPEPVGLLMEDIQILHVLFMGDSDLSAPLTASFTTTTYPRSVYRQPFSSLAL